MNSYDVVDSIGLVLDVCPSRASAVRSIEILERADMAECHYRDGEYHIIHPNGLDERIYNIWPSWSYMGGTIDDTRTVPECCSSKITAGIA